MRKMLLFGVLLSLLGGLAQAQPFEFKTGSFALSISGSGQVLALQDSITGKNYLAAGQKAALLRIRLGEAWLEPAQARFEESTGVSELTYPGGKATTRIQATSKPTHLVFELVKVTPLDDVSAVSWGPYPTVIGKTIGEVVGVVRDGTYAIGLQALNIKTLGGALKNAAGSDESRGTVAIKTEYGSSLQAYSLDRTKPRKISVHNNLYPEVPVDPIPDETTMGSKIALFGCPEKEALTRIGQIEVAEGLPHPLINGVWHKQSAETGRAYLITDFNEANIDKLIAYAHEAGLMSLPGQPTLSEWTVENTDAPQPLVFVLTALGKDGSISKPWIELGGYYKLEFPTDLTAGHSIVCDGEKLKLYNEKGNFEKEFLLSEKVASVAAGKNTLKFDCEFPNDEALKVRLVVKCIGQPELIARAGK